MAYKIICRRCGKAIGYHPYHNALGTCGYRKGSCMPGVDKDGKPENICPDCFAHNIQPSHVCPQWLKDLVTRYKNKIKLNPDKNDET